MAVACACKCTGCGGRGYRSDQERAAAGTYIGAGMTICSKCRGSGCEQNPVAPRTLTATETAVCSTLGVSADAFLASAARIDHRRDGGVG